MLRKTIIKSSAVLLPFSLLSRTRITRCEENDKYISDNKFKIVEGKDFKQNNPKYFACKFIGSNHNDFKYQLGINENTEKFNPNEKCVGGGLYFADVSNVFEYRRFGCEIATIELLDDEDIYIEDGKCKTNKFKITSIDSIENFVKKLKIDDVVRIIYKNPYDIRYMKNLPYGISEQTYRRVIDGSWELLKFIDNQTKESCKYAIEKSNGHALKHVKDQTEELCKFAIDVNLYSFNHIKMQTENLCLYAIEKNPNIIHCIKNPTQRTCEFAIEHAKKKCTISEEHEIHAYVLSKYWRLIDKISNPSFRALRILNAGFINFRFSIF